MCPPEHVTRTISGESVSIDVVKDLEVRRSWVTVALNPANSILTRDKRETQHRGEAT